MTSFTPFNRHILVKRMPRQETEETGILLPEDYKRKESLYEVVTVVECSPDCAFRDSAPAGAQIAVVSRFLEDISFANLTYTVILENHVLGRVLPRQVMDDG